RTGARSNTGASLLTRAVRACGPPVEQPIARTRGGVDGNGRIASTGAPSGTSGGAILSGVEASFGGCGKIGDATGTLRNRLLRPPKARILSISSRRKFDAAVTSRVDCGLVM